MLKIDSAVENLKWHLFEVVVVSPPEVGDTFLIKYPPNATSYVSKTKINFEIFNLTNSQCGKSIWRQAWRL